MEVQVLQTCSRFIIWPLSKLVEVKVCGARYPGGKRRDGLSVLFGMERKLNGVASEILQGFGGSRDVSPKASWRTTGTTPGESLETGTPKSVEGLSAGMSPSGPWRLTSNQVFGSSNLLIPSGRPGCFLDNRSPGRSPHSCLIE